MGNYSLFCWSFLILLITNRFQPLVGRSLLDVFVEGQMLHPTVGGGPVPMFGSLGNLNNGSRNELYGRFAPFLIPAPAGYANKDLHLLMVNMPIVPATGLEGHVGYAAIHRSQITVARKVLGISSIGLPFGPY